MMMIKIYSTGSIRSTGGRNVSHTEGCERRAFTEQRCTEADDRRQRW